MEREPLLVGRSSLRGQVNGGARFDFEQGEYAENQGRRPISLIHCTGAKKESRDEKKCRRVNELAS